MNDDDDDEDEFNSLPQSGCTPPCAFYEAPHCHLFLMLFVHVYFHMILKRPRRSEAGPVSRILRKRARRC